MNDHAHLSPPDGDDVPYAWLDEWLCEYVDGTMDPSLEAVFEEYVDANPELKAHIDELRETRDLLCGCAQPGNPPSKEARRRACNRVQSKVCSKVACDMLRSRGPSSAREDASLPALGIASSMAVALVVGLFAGALLFGDAPVHLSAPGPASAYTGSAASAQPSGPASAEADRGARLLDPFVRQTPTLVGASAFTPAVAMTPAYATPQPFASGDSASASGRATAGRTASRLPLMRSTAAVRPPLAP